MTLLQENKKLHIIDFIIVHDINIKKKVRMEF